MAFRIRAEDIRDPLLSEETVVRIEPVVDCDGLVCGTAVFDDDGEPVSGVRHDLHMVVSVNNPDGTHAEGSDVEPDFPINVDPSDLAYGRGCPVEQMQILLLML
jgi:hypothetical protein